MSKSSVIEAYADEKYRLQIHVDDYPSSPRGDDPLSVIVAWHRNYDFSDTNEFDTPEDFLAEMKRSKQQFYSLYLMDHSGVTLRTEPFGGLYGYWDSGQVGFVYAPDDRAREYLGVKRLTKPVRERIKRMIDSELETYTDYVNGNVYGFTIEARDPDLPPCSGEDLECDEPDEDDAFPEQLDSCWGFYGFDPKTNGMQETVEPELQYLFDRL